MRKRSRMLPVALVLLWWLQMNSGQPPVADGQTGSPIVVSLRPSSTVPDAVVTIGSVATVRGGDAWLRQQVERLDVADVSEIGRSATITREQVFFRIRLAGIEQAQFRVEGATVATATQSANSWSEKEIVATAKKAVLERLGADLADVEIELAQQIQLPELTTPAPAGCHLSAEVVTKRAPIGRVRVDVALVVNSMRVCAVPVVFEVACFRQVAVTMHKLDRGEALEATTIRSERKLLRGSDRCVVFSEKLFGLHALRTVPAGQFLTSADIEGEDAEDPILVKNRDTVKLIAIVGSLRITSMGEAMQDGRDGQLIQVRNLESSRVIKGRVSGPGMVEVEP
jgi:flagellar basal body P-ring formation protein FlgA